MKESPIFVVGMPRSGTTLVSAMLNAHPNIAIAPETHYFDEWKKRYQDLDIRHKDDFNKFWISFSNNKYFKDLRIDPATLLKRIMSLPVRDHKQIFSILLKAFAEAAGKPRWGEKTPGHYRYLDCLLSWYPCGKIVYVLRDPRAVVASLLKVPWGQQDMAAHARRWVSSMTCLDQRRNNHRVYTIKYENLVTNTEFELRSLSLFLDEDYAPSMLDYYRTSEILVSEEHWKMGVLQPLNTVSLTKWKTELSEKDVSLIEEITQSEMIRHDYQPICKIAHLDTIKKMVVVSNFLPRFDRSASNERLFHLLRHFTQNNLKIYYFYYQETLDDHKYKAAPLDNIEYIKLPPSVAGYQERITSISPDAVWVTNLWSVPYFKFITHLVRRLKTSIDRPLIVDTMDFHFKKYLRKAKVDGDSQALKTAYDFLNLEKQLYPIADKIIVVTDCERRDILQHVPNSAAIRVVSTIHPISNQKSLFTAPFDMCYLGNFEVNHNLDAVHYFLKKIFPKILQHKQDATFHVIGYGAEPYRKEFESANVRVIGYVDDIDAALTRYKLFVCPITYGAGMKGKLGHAAGVGLPIVTTTLGAEGFSLIDGVNCFIADNPGSFANKCLHLFGDSVAWHAFSQELRLMISEHYSPEIVTAQLNSILKKSDGGSPLYDLLPTSGKNRKECNAKNTATQFLQAKLTESGWKLKTDLYKQYLEKVILRDQVLKPIISIIVISWRLHPDTIKNFKILDGQRDQNFELILVNNGGGEKEFNTLLPYVNVQIKLNMNTGAYLARNIGASFSQAPVILFLEDDGVPEHDLVQSHIQAFQKYDVIAVRGVYLPKTKENRLNRLAKHYYLGNKPFPRHSDLEGNSSYDAKIFFQVGGWDDQIFFGGGGTDLSIRLLEVEPDMRKQIYYPVAVLYHDYAQSEAHLQNKRKRQFESWQRLSRKHPNINKFEKMWDKYFQREDLLVLKDLNDNPTTQHPKKLQNAKFPRHIMFIMYGWDDDGGGTIRPRLLAKELVKRGYTVSVIYAASRRKPLKPAYFVEESDDAGVRLFGVFNRPTLLCDIENPGREINDPRMCEIVKKIVSKQLPDVVHYHNLVGFSICVAEEVNKLNIPAIYTSRNYWPICPRLYLYREDLSLCTGPSEDGNKCAACIRRTDKKDGYAERLFRARRMLKDNVIRHIAISSRARDIFVENGFGGKKIYVLHQYPETLDWIWQQTGRFRRSKKSISKPLQVGFLGYVLPQKGVHIMVQALQQFQKEQIVGHIFGDGPNNYRTMLRNIDQKNLISFHGGYKPDDLPDLLAMLDLVVVPSVWEETQGVVVLEALAAKLPVIGSRIGGIPDFLEDGFNGYLVQPNDMNHLRNALSRIVNEPELLLKLQDNIQPPKSSSDYIEELIMHYTEAIAGHQSVNMITVNDNLILSKEKEAMVHANRLLTATKNGCGQKYSLYHTNGREESLKQWMAPYADAFCGCEDVLDIGCGPGLFLDLLKERGISGIGFDYDPEMVAICQSKDLNAKVVDAADLSEYHEAFGGIHLGHIIEHMNGESMVKMLEACVIALRPGGLLFVRTPNWQNETVRNGGFWLDHTHVRPYPLPLLEKIFEDLDLEVIKKGFEPVGWNDIFILGKKAGISRQRYSSEISKFESIHTKSSAFMVKWEGSQFVNHSLALVNRELCIELAKRKDIELSLIPYEPDEFGADEDPERFGLIANRVNSSLSGKADFHIRHQWPPNFSPPPEGHWILIQPWEFGTLPKNWIEPMQNWVDELWVPSSYVRDVYVNSGIAASKVFVIPNGVNYHQFNAAVPKYPLNTQKKIKFLFVGGTIGRKGIDVLLSAYAESFSGKDDVCLVIKDMGGESFYKGQNAAELIEGIKKDPCAPEILYLTETLKPEEIAGLYTACNCLVHPYRGEGFGLPVAEAMACGLPVIVTKGGACDDFCSVENAYLIDSAVRSVHLNSYELSGPGWLLEPNKLQLIEMLKYIYQHPNKAREKGAIAARQIRKMVDWKMSADLIMGRFKILKNKPVLRFANSKNHQAMQAKEVPQEIYQNIQHSIKNKKPEEVIRELESLAEAHPQFALAHNDLGVLHYQTGKKEKARHHYERAAALMPDNINFQKNLADFYYVELQAVEDALKIYVKILETHPQDVETLLALACICSALGKFDDASDFYQRVLDIDPGNEEVKKALDSLENYQMESKTPLFDSSDIAQDSVRANHFDAEDQTDIDPSKAENQGLSVSIIISLDGIQNRLRDCLASIQQYTCEPHEIIFIDNGATKGIQKWAQRMVSDHPNYRLLKVGKESHWPGCVNRGLNAASGKLVVILHSSMMVPEGWLAGMLDCLHRDCRIALVGPMTTNSDGIQKDIHADYCSMDDFDTYSQSFRTSNRHRRVPVTYLAAGCLLLKRELVKEIGQFDEGLSTAEMAIKEFCFRANYHGYQNVIAADVLVYQSNRHPNNKGRAEIDPAKLGDRKAFKEKLNALEMQNPAGRQLQILRILEQADQLSQKGVVEKAIEKLLHGIGILPADPRCYLALAKLLIKAKRFQGALDALKEMPNPDRSEISFPGNGDHGIEDDADSNLRRAALVHDQKIRQT
jgi:glycosyltransferase involved in cell wall biosynthesis/GT2 family glycosyltransferase/2-polyprenyl-3-methyl-5-hydroxy-6-metoxy-1,4-benzoquinol methylase